MCFVLLFFVFDMKEELSKEQREQAVEEYCEEKRLTALADSAYIY